MGGCSIAETTDVVSTSGDFPRWVWEDTTERCSARSYDAQHTGKLTDHHCAVRGRVDDMQRSFAAAGRIRWLVRDHIPRVLRVEFFAAWWWQRELRANTRASVSQSNPFDRLFDVAGPLWLN